VNKAVAYKDPKLPAPLAVSEKDDWAGALKTISAADAEILAAAIQTLYPHDSLPFTVYRRVVLHFDRLDAGPTLTAFCKAASASWQIPFSALAETYRVEALKRIESTPEFTFVQRMAVRYLYDDVEVWAAFGYEGASVHLGGYIKRGFDDLDWLPPLPNDL
jgi:hypothetical protein